MEKETHELERDFVSDSDILTFKSGILGFEDIKQYIFFFLEDDSPFLYLQALGCAHPCFVVCDPMSFVPDYTVNYDDGNLSELGAESPDDLRCLTIATIPDNIMDITINLKSPIVFNIKNNLAKQFVMDVPDYSIKHKLFNNNGAVE